MKSKLKPLRVSATSHSHSEFLGIRRYDIQANIQIPPLEVPEIAANTLRLKVLRGREHSKQNRALPKDVSRSLLLVLVAISELVVNVVVRARKHRDAPSCALKESLATIRPCNCSPCACCSS